MLFRSLLISDNPPMPPGESEESRGSPDGATASSAIDHGLRTALAALGRGEAGAARAAVERAATADIDRSAAARLDAWRLLIEESQELQRRLNASTGTEVDVAGRVWTVIEVTGATAICRSNGRNRRMSVWELPEQIVREMLEPDALSDPAQSLVAMGVFHLDRKSTRLNSSHSSVSRMPSSA